MTATSVTFDLLARDRASQAFKNVGQASDGLHAKFGKLATAATTLAKGALIGGVGAAVGGLTAVFTTGIGEVSDYQRGFAQLTQGLKTTHNAAGITAKQMEKLASSIQGYSGQTDDSVVAAEQLLLTFTNIRNEAGKGNDVFTQTTKIAADMAARMGGDASTQAIRLGKALNDPVKGVTALQRVGVSFTEGQKKQIKAMVDSGHTMAAQKLILGELNKEFGGSAKAVGDTLPGMIAKAKRHFEDFAQGLVTRMLPTLTKLAHFLADDVVPAVQALVSRGLARAMPAIQAVGQVISEHLAPAFVAVAGFIRSNVLPILQAVAQFVVDKLYPAIARVLGGALDGLRMAFQHISKTVAQHREQLQALGNFIRKVAEIAVKVLAPVLSVVLKTAFRILGTAISVLITVIAGFVHAIRSTAHFAEAAGSGIKAAFNAVVGFFQKMPDRIARVASGMWDGIKNAFKDAVNWVIDHWNNLSFGMDAVKIHGHTIIPGFHIGTPNIPRLAMGGIIPATPGGRLILAGEAGRAERVTPLGGDGMSAGERAIVAELRRMPIVRLSSGSDVYQLRRGG